MGNPIEKLVIMEEGKELAERSTPSPSSDRVAAGGVVWTGMKLCGCIAGLQVSYLTWGVMQVKKKSESVGMQCAGLGELSSEA